MDINLPKQLKISCFEPKALDIDLPKQLKISCFEPKFMNIDLPKQFKLLGPSLSLQGVYGNQNRSLVNKVDFTLQNERAPQAKIL